MNYFGASHGWEESKKAPFSEIFHIYPTMIKLEMISYTLPKEDQKIYIYILGHIS